MSRLKKLLCALVCICIMMSCFPVGVFSKGGGDSAVPFADPGVTDTNFIRVRKTFEGITDETKIPSGFKVTVSGAGKSYDLKITDSGVKKSTTATALVYEWVINKVGAGTYIVSETDADKVDKYDLVSTTGLGSVTVKAASFTVDSKKETTCSHKDWPVDITGDTNFLFAAALTSGDGCVVISKEALSASQKLNVEKTVTALGGNWKTPVYFYSIATNGNGPWTVSEKELEYKSDGKIWLKATSNWSHVATLSFSVTEASNPEISITNKYTPNTIDIPVEKVWEDSGNADGNRPSSVIINLLENGKESGKTLTLTAGKDWKDTFVDLPIKDKDGKKIDYSVSEDTSASVFGTGEGKYQFKSVTGTQSTGFTVTNTYTPVPPKPDTVTISGTKTLTGKTLTAGDFTFILSYEGAVKDTTTNAADGSFGFTFTPSTTPGTYVYEVSEKNDGKAGINYDGTRYVVSVKVGDDGKPDASQTTIAKDGASVTAITFTNTYAPTPTSVTLTGTKTLNGRTLAADEFSFLLTETTSGSTYTDTAANAAGGSFSFKEITYSAPGIYTYTVKEVKPAVADIHIEYDTAVYDITVVVTDNSGQLEKSVTMKNGTDTATAIAFSNTYTPTAVNAQFTGTKTLTGKTLAAGDFSFVLSEGATNIETVKNAADGSFSFTAISYSAACEHTYTVKEVKGTDSHITYDESVYTITVAVVKNADGTLSKTETIKDKDGTTVSAITFSNTYTPEPTKVTINGMKTLTGKTLAGDDFIFTLTGDGGVNDSAKNDAEGKFTFKEIKYTSEGKFEYTVKEVKGSDSTITYDESEYKITVVITDVDGVLTPEMKIEKNGDAAEAITFNNKYTPPYIPPVHDDDPTVITIKVRKTWDDSDNTYGLRPDTITVRLFADGVEKAHKTMTKDDGWKEISFTVAYKSGTKYEVKEDAVPGYLTTITGSEKTGGFDIVNKYDGGMGGTGGPGEDPEIPAEEEPGRGGSDEKTEISVTKVWSDNNNAYRKRPSSITVKLYANGKDSGKELSLTSAAGWKGSFTELPVYDEDDALIVYTVKEVAVSGYTSKVTGDPENGFTITNTIKNTNVPKTGDNSRPALWTGLLLASALGFAAAAFGGKKTGRKKSR